MKINLRKKITNIESRKIWFFVTGLVGIMFAHLPETKSLPIQWTITMYSLHSMCFFTSLLMLIVSEYYQGQRDGVRAFVQGRNPNKKKILKDALRNNYD